ncbi:MAG: DUF3800 domain-containing protein [Candidatus Micrarchaeota archaeon]
MATKRFVFIDESGDLGMGGSKYLVLAALAVDDPAPLKRIIKNMRRNKFKKELRKASEIKANKSSVEVRKHMLAKLNEVQDARICYVVLEKKKLLSDYLKSDKNKLYNYVAGKLARTLEIGGFDVEIRIDKSKGKPLLRQDFNDYFRRNLLLGSPGAKVVIEHSYSQAWAGLQFADMLAWACFQKFEHSDSEYVDLVKLVQEVSHVW